MNLSGFLLTPPPRMNRLGLNRRSMATRCSSRSDAQAFHDRPRRIRALAAERRSASRPRISMWPSSVFGTRTPSTNSADPRPVPRVSTNTVPVLPRPAPKRISATPAASASLTIVTSRDSRASELDGGRIVDPAGVDVGGRSRRSVDDDRRDPDPDRGAGAGRADLGHGPPDPDDQAGGRGDDRVGRRRVRRGDPDPLADELASVEIDRAGLDPAAADVEADRQVRHGPS